ncbi:MAG: DUF4331 domain-containing protein [Gammaproteobacteria bacterium]|nr:DUF4331 domain-containing protein [Gammaproteobacteria bacterium]
MAAGVAAACAGASITAQASSHREAPLIAGLPKVDNTDFYMFNSYESGREGFVTIIANWVPLQDSYGGPNYFALDDAALYEMHIDNNGDAVEDITFQFQFDTSFRKFSVPTGPGLDGAPTESAIPLINIGPISRPADANLNRVERYTMNVVRGDRRSGVSQPVTDSSGATSFIKPVDNIGEKSIPDYQSYADAHISDITIPGCSAAGARVFVGQRREGFYINLGEVFDLINLNPVGDRSEGQNIIDDKNVTSFALEVPTECLTAGQEPVIGAWATASLPQARVLDPTPDLDAPTADGGAWTQVSRLGSPLVNEVVIGLPDKNLFNASQPANDVSNFATYVTNPTLPVLANVLFDTAVPTPPRLDLVQAFVTGVDGLTKPANVNLATLAGAGEMLRLNTAVPATPIGSQSDLAFLGCDLSGFPNGRRPIDDVVDIALSVALGAITAENPNGLQTCDVSNPASPSVVPGAVVTDGASLANAGDGLFIDQFPYLGLPLPGSPFESSEPNGGGTGL